jgi:NAD(P)-dependent dehydrogenase (short-subunit alcohol dehydrogenase family)
MPKPKPLMGKVAVVTGGAGGIGAAIAGRLISEGAVVIIADRDGQAAEGVASGFRKQFGSDAAHAITMDVTDEAAVIATFQGTARLHGGVDIVVNNAGISSAAAVEDTSLDLWNLNMSILATGYFLVAREGYRIMKTQGFGGALIFIGSKNGVAASAGASAYCTAKAAEIHLARCMALEGAAHGIRVNVVNPDAVLRGSKIWQGEWRQQRAANNKIAEDDLEEFYRNRSLLKRSVFPEDIAEAVHFFANENLSGKSTGNFLNVDAGNAQSFTR